MGVINRGFCDVVSAGGHTYEILGISASGRVDKVNQDSFGYYFDDRCLIVAIADGLGSAPLSHFGSRAAIDSVFKVMPKSSPGNIWRHIFENWELSIDGELEKYDTTCKFVCIREDRVIIGSIGDGWIGMLNTDGYCELENTNSFTNRTDSLCSQNMLEKASILECDIQDIMAFGLSTDGFSEDLDRNSRGEFLHDAYGTMSGSFSDMYSELCSALHNWPVKTNGDDKTAVLIRKVE